MKTISCVIAALALASCGKPETAANDSGNSAAANVDVDILPPDESVATPDGELANGAQNVGGANEAGEGNLLDNVTP